MDIVFICKKCGHEERNWIELGQTPLERLPLGLVFIQGPGCDYGIYCSGKCVKIYHRDTPYLPKGVFDEEEAEKT